jgi:hypothetical protein
MEIPDDMISSAITRIAEISQTFFGSEDDLIHKIILPFFEVIGYGPDLFEVKFPVKAYRPNRRGRKPEADCVFFSGAAHQLSSSLLVAEIKRDEEESPEQQARFYSANLFVPFYVSWSGLRFEVWQLQNFRPPALISRYRLDQIDRVSFSELKELLAPNQIVKFCADNEIKTFDGDTRRKDIETRYLDRLAIDLRSFKALDLPQIREVDAHYVELRLRELEVIPLRDVEEEIKQGVHPVTLGKRSDGDRTFRISELLDKMSAIAVIGDPGAGKTTLLRRLCLENAYSDSRFIPVFISTRVLVSAGETVAESALRQIRCYGDTENPSYLYEAALAQGRILVCIDGIDELGIDEPKDAQAAVVRFNSDLSNILARHPGNRVVISVRRESWPVCRPLLHASLREFEVLPFTRSAVRLFVSRWFADSRENAERVIDSLRARDWPSYATNPLLLTLTCACIPVQGDVPKRSSDLLGRFLSFILEQGDSTRRISQRPSAPNLNPETLSPVVAEVALAFHLRRRAALARSEVISLLADHLASLGATVATPRDVFLELTTQHGLLRSWSIDEHYAFPHLSFQSYFAAKSLRSQAEGHRTIADHKHDPFWREASVFYAELGDISELARLLLSTNDNILRSDLLLVAECWAAGGEIGDLELPTAALYRLLALANGENKFLADQAIRHLARISTPEAKKAFATMIRDSNGHFAAGAASRFAVSVLGDAILPEVVEQLVRTGHSDDLLENFRYLPRQFAVEQLRQLILRTDFSTSGDAGVHHLRRDAERLMAEVGEDLAVSPLMELISARQLSDFEKSGCITALATIDDPRVPQILRDIVSGSLPMDCRIEAARNLAPGEPEARHFLVQVIADGQQDYFDRRDAAGALASFDGLADDVLPAFRSLIFDRQPVFVGGPMVAVSTVGQINTKASRALLKEALTFWEESDNEKAGAVRNDILEALNLGDHSTDLRTFLEDAGGDHWINPALRRIALEYSRRSPENANALFVSALRAYSRDAVYLGTLAWAILMILPQIPLSDSLLEAAIYLAKRLPRASLPWSAIAMVWQRRDISDAQRALFM